MRDRGKGSGRWLRVSASAGGLLLAALTVPSPAAADPHLDEMVAFTGQIFFLQTEAPGMVIAAIRDGETAVFGFGETAKGSGKEPDTDTLMRVGSITKPFTGHVLAALAAAGEVGFTDMLESLRPELANRGERPIRLIDLVTHSAGTPREIEGERGPDDDPFAGKTAAYYAEWLSGNDLLFTPGSAILYSNFGFDLLAMALSTAAETPYPELLASHVTGPLGMADTTFRPDEGQLARTMQGHNFDGSALPTVPTGEVIVGSGGLYSTAGDLLKWLAWHLDRFAAEDAEVRLLDHAVYLPRDGLETVYGMDESGEMSAMGLGWVVMEPEGNRPLILQKAGGRQGQFSYIAFAPTRGVGVFISINQFDFAASMAMATVANDLIAELAPR